MTTVVQETGSAGESGSRPTDENFFEEFVTIMAWIGRTVIELPGALRYPTEVLRQVAILIKSSSLVLCGMLFAAGLYVGEIGHYVLSQIGAQAYIGVFSAAGTVKATCPVFFGYMLSAKIGCGYVAELGAMRINDEIDAMEVMGLPSRQYLVGTRVMAGLIVVPLLFITATGVSFVSNYIINVVMLGTSSSGGFLRGLWAFTTPTDLFVNSMIWAYVPSMIAIIVATYYGYNARGGAVGVGDNTAKSQVFNLVQVNILGAAVIFQLLYGTGVALPIGN